jgi:hypothetical protein
MKNLNLLKNELGTKPQDKALYRQLHSTHTQMAVAQRLVAVFINSLASQAT